MPVTITLDDELIQRMARSTGGKPMGWSNIIKELLDEKDARIKREFEENWKNLQDTMFGYDREQYTQLIVTKKTQEMIHRVSNTIDKSYTETIDFLLQFYFENMRMPYEGIEE